MRDAENIERAARDLRRKLKIDDQLRPDMITVIFKLKNLRYINDYRRVPDDKMSGSEAYFDPETGLLHISESTFCSANDHATCSDADRRRARYTIAHEIGHIALGHTALRHRGVSNRLRKSAPGHQRDEREADMFSAAFLAPAHLAI